MTGVRSQLAIFDLDGVLIDSEGIAADVLAQALSAAGYPVSVREVVEQFIGIGVPAILRRISEATARVWPPDYQHELEAAVREAVYSNVRVMSGMENLLLALPGSSWCIGSNSDADRIAKCLQLGGLSPRFQPRIFSGTRVARGKPAPDLFLAAAESFRVQPSECVVIEDTVVGVTAGKAAGMQVIGFLGGSHWRGMAQDKRLRDAGADMLVADADELAALLHVRGYLRPD